MIKFYSTSDSGIDALKQASSSKNNKKTTLSWMSVINNWRITLFSTKEKCMQSCGKLTELIIKP